MNGNKNLLYIILEIGHTLSKPTYKKNTCMPCTGAMAYVYRIFRLDREETERKTERKRERERETRM